VRSGQPLTGPGGLVEWHPRDVDTLIDIYDQVDAAAAEAAAEARFDQARRELQGMG
jgi:hypothetical protein